MPIADRIYILAADGKRFEGSPGDVRDDRQIMDIYMGGARTPGSAAGPEAARGKSREGGAGSDLQTQFLKLLRNFSFLRLP